MANLSQDDCHHKTSSGQIPRSSTRLTSKGRAVLQPGSINYNDTGNNSDQGPLQAVLRLLDDDDVFIKLSGLTGRGTLCGYKSRLLTTLQGHDVALTIHSKTGNGDLASELHTIFRRVWNGDFNHKKYRLLLQLVIKEAPDVDIWNAVFDLIRVISRLIPSSSLPVLFHRTPAVYSSASMQRDEQTKRLLELSLFDEIKNCTYRNVEGFFAKFLRGMNGPSEARRFTKP